MTAEQQIDLGDGLVLPVDAVTTTFSVLAMRGMGKTHTASVIAEEMLEQRQRVAIIDPLGVWWGLRSSSDGNSEGYPVVIFGGDHADLPLEPGAGELVANLVVDNHIACIIDLSHMRKAEQRTFMTAFAETLYHRNRNPLHLIVDEADLYAGQRPPKGAERLLGAMEDLVRRGRARGIGLTLISQRPAVLHKDVLSQTAVLISLRLVSPQDTRALDEWISQHDIDNQRKEFLASLPSLPVGTAWFWSPGTFDMFRKVKVRPRRTYDSSRTPKVGETVTQPREYARVDLAVVQQQMAELVDRAKLADPKHLRTEVAALTRENARLRAEADRVNAAAAPVETLVEVRVEVPVLDDAHAQQLRDTAQTLHAAAQEASAVAGRLLDAVAAATARREAQPARAAARPAPARQQPRYQPQGTTPGARTPARARTQAAAETSGAQDAYDGLRAGTKRIMEALATFYPDALTPVQVGALAKMKHKSGTFSTYVSELKRAGLIENATGGALVATEVGAAVAGVVTPKPTTRKEVYDLWTGRGLRAGVVRILDAVLEAAPASLTKDEVAAAAEMSAASGTFSTYLSELRRFGLVTVTGQDVSLGEVWEIVP